MTWFGVQNKQTALLPTLNHARRGYKAQGTLSPLHTITAPTARAPAADTSSLFRMSTPPTSKAPGSRQQPPSLPSAAALRAVQRSPRRLMAQSPPLSLHPSAPTSGPVRHAMPMRPSTHGLPFPTYTRSRGPAAPILGPVASVSNDYVCPFLNSRPCMRPPFATAEELVRHCREEHHDDPFNTEFHSRWNTHPRVREALAAWVSARKAAAAKAPAPLN